MSVAGGGRGCAIAAAAALALVVLVSAVTPVDTLLSDLVFDGRASRWPVSHEHGWLRFACYEGPKYLVGLIWLGLVAGLVRPRLLAGIGLARREAAFLVSCLALVPLVVGLIKYHSGVVCAGDLARYGGPKPDVLGHFGIERLFATDVPRGCWPSGHASGGYALMAFGFLDRPLRQRLWLWITGAGVGTAMGAYQVARGAHFPSHVLVTALIAQLLICALAVAWRERPAH